MNIELIKKYKKEEKPKFKVDDFVRYINSNNNKALRINNINCERYYFDNSGIVLRLNEMIKWEPQAGELCWFTNNKVTNNARLAEFHSLDGCSFKDNTGSWKYCEPFLNSKPSWFK